MEWGDVVHSLVENQKGNDATQEKFAIVVNKTAEKVATEIKENIERTKREEEYVRGGMITTDDPSELSALRLELLAESYSILIEEIDKITVLYENDIKAHIDSPKLGIGTQLKIKQLRSEQTDFIRKEFTNEVEALEKKMAQGEEIDDKTFVREKETLSRRVIRI